MQLQGHEDFKAIARFRGTELQCDIVFFRVGLSSRAKKFPG